ncbi:MAG: ABC transporter substrate-binding protein [Bacteroidetes bacterium]|nr:MAG: ABC transporter substrate-binding protein [Bacteroidota bacterium]
MKMQNINILLISAFFATCFLMLSCNESSFVDDPRVFRYNESAGITTLDPAHARSLELMWVADALYDGLVELKPNLEIAPALAHSWNWDESGVIFHLRSGVMFTPQKDVPGLEHGREVKAQDFVYSLERLRNPDVASPGGWILESVAENGIIALNDSTLRINMKYDFPPFLGLLTTPYASVVASESVEYHGADFRSNPAGTGPFKLAWWVEDVALVLHKNEVYWERDSEGKSLPYLDAVHIDFVPDMGSEYLGLIQGRYDFISGLHPAYMEDLMDVDGGLSDKHSESITLERVPFLKTDYIGLLVDGGLELNTSTDVSGVLQNRNIRKALSISIDREGIARNLRRSSVLPSDKFVPPSMPGSSEYSTPVFDVEKAKQLLKEAGYPNGEGFPELELSTTSDYVDICAAIQHGWEQLGLTIQIDVSPPSVHREKVSTSKSEMFKKSWLADYADAENFLGLFLKRNFAPGGPNYTHFQNEYYEELYESAMSEPSLEDRKFLYNKMDSIIYAETPVIPLFHDQVTHFVRNSIDGWVVSPVNRLELRYVKKQLKD